MRQRGSKVELRLCGRGRRRPGGMVARGARAWRCTDTGEVEERYGEIEGRAKKYMKAKKVTETLEG